ncbi:MAG: cyclase family protein [Elusimicrobia bacterium]|nr:cyclase family protein [Elusimicrobiota bacterium]
MKGWIDVTAPLQPRLPSYPGNRPFSLCWVERLESGGPCNLSALDIGSHAGTHVDAPLHFIEEGAPIERVPLADLCGPCRVVDIDDARRVDLPELRRTLRGRVPERLLLRTRNSRRKLMRRKSFAKDFVYLTPEAASWLVEGGARLVGIDYLSIERFGFKSPDTHRALLGAGVPIIEGLELSEVRPGSYELFCMPLLVTGADGAPARAALRSPA